MDLRTRLLSLPECSIDAIVSESPEQMTTVEACMRSIWHDVLRVMKPGAHIAIFADRDFDLLSLAIRLGGFELRDVIGYTHEGQGAVRPAWTPIILARRPMEGTVAENVKRHGCGGINIDASRVGNEARPQVTRYKDPAMDLTRKVYGGGLGGTRWDGTVTTEGRWPANVIHDGSDQVQALFSNFGESSSSASARVNKGATKSVAKGWDRPHVGFGHEDEGTAARFFLTVSRDELTTYLQRMLLPPGGTLLDLCTP